MIFTTMLCAAISIVEIGVYKELHVKLFFSLMLHMRHMGEIFRTTPTSLIFIILAMAIVLFYVSYKMMCIFLPSAPEKTQPLNLLSSLKLLAIFLLTTTLLIIGTRGGLNEIPINQGQVYFCENQCVNDATVNPFWNLLNSFAESRIILKGDAFKVMDDKEAADIVSKLYTPAKDTTIHIFKVTHPNVCILILESWTADLIHSLGGYDSLDPNFEKLIRDGYLFTHIKPSGHVSDQGVPAILSGYPALPIGSVINQTEKQVTLANLNDEFSEAGYRSSFFFGGQLIYGNIKTYVYRDKYDRVVEQDDLPPSIPSGKLGIHDSIMLNIWRDSMNTFKQPFFSCLFTLSTHPPFDEPQAEMVHWGGDDAPLLNSVIYSDRQLSRFFEEAKKTKWYNNTIFILVADHGHGTPKNHPYDSPEFYHIPLLICGGALKDEYRGVKNDRIGSQTDIASTLLHQLNLPDKNYQWSNNLMNPYSNKFAYYVFDVGYGFEDSTGVVVWNKLFPQHNSNTAKSEESKNILAKKGAAMLQVEMKDFLAK